MWWIAAAERQAKLAGGVAVIKVGAPTEVELKEKKHRIEDALSATRAGVEEGMVAGGGTALVNALPALDTLEVSGDEKTGVDILRRARWRHARLLNRERLLGTQTPVIPILGSRRQDHDLQ